MVRELGGSILRSPDGQTVSSTARDVLTVSEGLHKMTGGALDVCQTR